MAAHDGNRVQQGWHGEAKSVLENNPKKRKHTRYGSSVYLMYLAQ
jgi:hypothetical protein